MYIYVFIYVYIYIYIHTYTYILIDIHVCIYIYYIFIISSFTSNAVRSNLKQYCTVLGERFNNLLAVTRMDSLSNIRLKTHADVIHTLQHIISLDECNLLKNASASVIPLSKGSKKLWKILAALWKSVPLGKTRSLKAFMDLMNPGFT
jgi:hypothetical protein